MQIFLKNWVDKFLDEIGKTTKLRIVSPFVNEQVIRKTQSKFDFKNFELITRFSMRDFASGVSSLNSLKFSMENGASIYGIKGLHSKIYLFDNRSAIVTSANLTNGGLINNHECGIFITDPEVIKGLHKHLDELRQFAGSKLTKDLCEKWLDELENINIENTILPSLPDYGASQNFYDASKDYFVKFFGSAKHRVSLTHAVRQEMERSLCHYACGFSKKPQSVNEGDIIYLARITKNPNDYAIFGKAEAIKFVEKRDTASPADIIERPYKEHYPYYLRVRNAEFIDAAMYDCVFLRDLIEALKYESFPTTKEKYEQGMKDVNPYRTLVQQPYVRLTENAVNWLEPRFQDTLGNYGAVDPSYISTLPQSRILVP